MKFGFGVQIWLKDNHLENFHRMLDEMSLEGLDGVEFFYPCFYEWYSEKPKELRRLLDMHDLELSDYYSGVGFRNEELHKATVETAKKRYRMVADLGYKNVLIDEAGGNLPLPCGEDDYVKIVAEGANEMGLYAKSLGLTLSWHNHWGNIFETPEPFHKFVAQLDNDLCGLCIDVGQLKLGGYDEVDTVRRYVNRIKFMHYKDVTFAGRPQGQLYPGGPTVPTNTGAYTVDAKGRWVELGRGCVDFVGITKALVEGGYDGWIVDDLDISSYSPRESVAACKDYLNNGLGIWTEKDYRTGKAPKQAK